VFWTKLQLLTLVQKVQVQGKPQLSFTTTLQPIRLGLGCFVAILQVYFKANSVRTNSLKIFSIHFS